MHILKYVVNSLSFNVDIGGFLIGLPFFMIGFLFLSVLYLTLRLWISDIILKFLIECFTNDIVDLKDYPKKDRNSMNGYISIGLIISYIVMGILSDFVLNDNYILYYVIEGCVVAITTTLIYKKVKKVIIDKENLD